MATDSFNIYLSPVGVKSLNKFVINWQAGAKLIRHVRQFNGFGLAVRARSSMHKNCIPQDCSQLVYREKWLVPAWIMPNKSSQKALDSVSGSALRTEKILLALPLMPTRRLCVLANTKLYHRNLLLWISVKFTFYMAETIFIPNSKQYQT